MKPVQVLPRRGFAQHVQDGEWYAATIHAWGTDNDSREMTCPYPVGVVEFKSSGEIMSISVERIRFQSPGGGDENGAWERRP